MIKQINTYWIPTRLDILIIPYIVLLVTLFQKAHFGYNVQDRFKANYLWYSFSPIKNWWNQNCRIKEKHTVSFQESSLLTVTLEVFSLAKFYSLCPPIHPFFFWQEWFHKKPGITPWRAHAKHPPISWIPAAGRCSFAECWHNDPITLVLQYFHPDFSQVRLMKDTGSHGEHKKRAVAMCSAGSSASTILQCLTGFQCISLSGGTLAYHRILHRWICLSWGTSIPSGNSITDSPTNTQTLQFLPKFKINNPDIYTIS